MRTKTAGFRQNFPLNGEGIDAFAEVLEEQLILHGVENENRIRIRFSLEEALLRMRDHFGEDESFHLKVDTRIGSIQIQIVKEGPVYNPLSKTEVELEDWSGSLLTAVGLSPLYSYSRGRNVLRVSLSRKGMHPALKILIAAALGLTAGILIRTCLSPETIAVLTDSIFMPVYDLWIRILRLLSGPMIFIMVLTSTLNVRPVEEEGGDSRQVLFRYFLMSLLAAAMAIASAGLVFHEPLVWGKTLGTQMSEYLPAILRVVPQDIVTPLLEGNTPQILLLAVVLGEVIKEAGDRTAALSMIIRQANTAGLLLMAAVSRSVPFFAGVLLCLEVMQNNLRTFSGMWVMLVLSVLTAVVFAGLVLLYITHSRKVPARILLKKLRPAFVVSMRTGSIEEGYGKMEKSCTRRLGIEHHFTVMSLPHGLLLYMPVNVIGTLLFTVFAALKYQVSISLGWIIIAMVMAVVLFVATPPVPGANLLAYIMIFSLLTIPSEALIDAMIFDMLFGIFASAANQTLLQMELIMQADRIGLLDRSVLCSAEKRRLI
ncbi:MAG: cation:dicarboxylase symporter family transporter [Firmicutes bacterium]|nr:cation:dicarboxylase symporter family transporter [Bacillota bacterium]